MTLHDLRARIITPEHLYEGGAMLMLLEPGDVARRLGRSTTTVRLLTMAGVLKPIATTPRGVKLYDPEAVALLAQRRRQSQPRT
jgi:hypothetical protein